MTRVAGILTGAFLLVCVAWSLAGQEPSRSQRRDPQPQIRYPLGADSLPQDGVPKGKLEGPFLFHSQIIQNTVRKYWIYVPAQYKADEAACVLVFQDGARATNPNGVLRVPQVLENLIAKKQIPVTVGIFITPGQVGNEFPESIGTGNPNNRDKEYDVLNDAYARFIVEEMLPEVGKKYNLTKDPAGRAIGGSSSGAICAFTVAWERPQEFRNVVSMIGSFTNIHGGHVYPDLVRSTEKKPIRIFLQDGVNDLRSPGNLERDWHIQNQKMVAAFKDRSYDMAHVFGQGGHSDDHGGAMLPQMLRWIWRDYPGVVASATDLIAEAAAIAPQQTELFAGYDSTAKVDPSGTWTWQRSLGPNTSVSNMTIVLQAGKISGSLETQRGEDAPRVVGLADPVLNGNKLVFDVKTEFRGQESFTTYQGIVQGDSIKGWQVTSFGGNQRDTQWTASRVKPTNLLKPTDRSDSWFFETTEPGKGSKEVVDGAIVFNTTQTSSENWHVQTYQTGIDLQEAKVYEVKFTAKSPNSSSVLLNAMIHQEDWHNIGLQEEIYLTPGFKDFAFTFTASGVVEKNNRIGFAVGIDKGSVFIKNMTLTQK